MAGSVSADWGARDRRVWHQMTGRPPEGAKGPIILAEGDGAWVTDVDGNRYLDGLSGQWCVNVGYGRERLANAAAEQLKRLAFHPLTRGHVPAIELGERLDALLGGARATFYSNSGSEANELAFKLVRQYHQLRGDTQRFKIIARYRAYHGSTLGALSATGQAMRRIGYEPLAPVADVHAPLAGEAVEVAVAVDVGDPRAVAGLDDDRTLRARGRAPAHLMPDGAVARAPVGVPEHPLHPYATPSGCQPEGARWLGFGSREPGTG